MKKRSKRVISLFLAAAFLFIIFACKTVKEQDNTITEGDSPEEVSMEWTKEVDSSMKSLVDPPEKIPFYLRIFIKKAEKNFNKELLPSRVLAWSPKIGIGSGYLELYIEKGAAKILDKRLITIIRMYVSYTVPCAFAIDVNSRDYKEFNITVEEIKGLQGLKEIDTIKSFSDREKTALKYSFALTKTPVSFDGKLLGDLRRLFSENEIVAIASLAAKVNYWARLIEAWRIKPAGYTDDPILRLEQHNTYESTEN